MPAIQLHRLFIHTTNAKQQLKRHLIHAPCIVLLTATSRNKHKVANPWTPHTMNPNLTNAMFQQTGMPTMGRRYMGYGASPFGPGGPVPILSMNYLGQGMAHHGSMNTIFGAGQYPNPRLPFPLGMMGAGNQGLGRGGRGPWG